LNIYDIFFLDYLNILVLILIFLIIYIEVKKNLALTVQTKQLTCLNEFYYLFIFNDKKIIKEELYNYIDYISIAHWIMGDSSKKNKGIILCTDNFKLKEVIILMNILKIKFNVDSTIHKEKNKPRIYINEKNFNILKPHIKPHFVKSMLYKIHSY